ncbi:39S ribosomal protein L38, mitochondrial [Orussus abietinus]|uniref:39S ribosomal protein L38, mitochondrial n=1 Tax=Orussus abietinus TaxID=222816 RepID=UPI000625F5AA|nr:39S ribosomal protein L38, mitochondrial [Orussus abietinus]
MAVRLFRLISSDLILPKCQDVRYTGTLRGRNPTVARNLKQRLEEVNAQDLELSKLINIGFSQPTIVRRDVRAAWIDEIKANKANRELEKLAMRKELSVDLDKVRRDWSKTIGPSHIHRIAEHFGIFKDLYGDAYFVPVVPLNVGYNIEEEDLYAKVYTGNIIKPNEAKNVPQVSYEADPDSLWTLLLTTPDGNLTSKDLEYCHWFIGNIPGNSIEKGELLLDYIRPFPARGIGYCRYIFVLYKQDKLMDYSKYKKTIPCLSLTERNWSTQDFYREHQDYLTPAGLTFFQSDWDHSLTDFYHNTLQMMEPVFEYNFPEHYLKPQTWFPLKQAFNLYLDRYRDQKQINKEFFLRKMKKVHPFKAPPPSLKYPNAHPFNEEIPSWLRTEIKKERLRWGRINELS